MLAYVHCTICTCIFSFIYMFHTHWSFSLSYKRGRAQKHDQKLSRWHDVFLFTLSHLTTISKYLHSYVSPLTVGGYAWSGPVWGLHQYYGDDISMDHLTYPGIPCETPSPAQSGSQRRVPASPTRVKLALDIYFHRADIFIWTEERKIVRRTRAGLT